MFDLDATQFDTSEEAGEFQSIVHAAIVNAFTDETGNPFADQTEFSRRDLRFPSPGATNERVRRI